MNRIIYLLIFFFVHYTSASGLDILFVGNSLTYSNDLPTVLKQIAQDFEINITTECICKPNTALIDHWEDATLLNALQQRNYDLIVLQQGPSSQAWGREMLLKYGKIIQSSISSKNTKIAYFMVWPAFSNHHTLEGVVKNYTDAALTNNALLFPVGKVFYEYLNITDDFSVFQGDFFHPSSKGTYLAAWLIFRTLYPEIIIANYRNSEFKKKRFETLNDIINNLQKS